MNCAEINEYVGLDYKLGASGPDSYDCWNLLTHVQREHFGINMPSLPIGNAEVCASEFRTRVECGDWLSTLVPQHGDGVLLRGGELPHVGIYLTDNESHCGVLHALEDVGVIWTPIKHLRIMGFSRVKYYRILK